MKLTKALLLLFVFSLLAVESHGQLYQQNLIYSNYFVNPYLYNPSIIAPSGYTELSLNYRQQSIGKISRTSTLNLQVPLSYKSAIGVNVYNDQAGVLQTNTGMLSFAYQIYFGTDVSFQHKLAFGLSAGMTSGYLSNTNLPSSVTDATITTSSISNIDGQFGISYQLQNFKLGVSLPRLLKSQEVYAGSYKVANIDPARSTITTMSYNFKLSDRISFEPIAMYRTEVNVSWFEGLGAIKIDRLGWIGGYYRNTTLPGVGAFLGLNIKDKLKFGYAYEVPTGKVNGIGTTSHELQLILRLGKKQKARPAPKAKEPKEEPVEEVKEEPKQQEPKQEEPKEEVKTNEPTQPAKEQPQTEIKPQTEVSKPVEQVTKPSETTPEVKEEQPAVVKQVAKTLSGENLAPGHYVVVGAFQSSINAKNYAATLKRAGYPAEVAFDPTKKYYIVHMGNAPDLDEARRLRDVYRAKSRYSFKDTWILSIE